MPSTLASRTVLRQSRLLLRQHQYRQASTAAETASKAKDTASTQVSKASEGLSRVTSSAGSGLSRATDAARGAMGRIGGRTGRVIRYVESLIPPTIYYGRVGLELGRIMFQGQGMSPPSIAHFQSYFQPITKAMQNPRNIMSSAESMTSGVSPESILSRIRNVSRQDFASIGVVGAEILGFFTVGTMLGRMKLVGYHGEPHHEH